MQHNITVIATETDGSTAHAVTGPDGATDIITVTVDDVVAVITAVGDVLGLKLDGITANPGDTIMVTGSVGTIPDYQVGALLTVDVDGWAHFVNAGAVANAITSVYKASPGTVAPTIAP